MFSFKIKYVREAKNGSSLGERGSELNSFSVVSLVVPQV